MTGRLVLGSILTLAVSASGSLVAQIPKEAKWEVTFAQVEAVLDLSELSTAASETYEARVMQRPWSAFAPMPFLRIVRVDGAIRAQMFVYWRPAFLGPRQRPVGSDIVCRDGICVRPIGMAEQQDWREVVEALALDACPREGPREGKPPPGPCADCEEVWIKTKVGDTYREQSCNEPKLETPAGEILRLMKTATDASRWD
jgi:hypothetical protein